MLHLRRVLFGATSILCLVSWSLSSAQAAPQDDLQIVDSHLKAGEYSSAIGIANRVADPMTRDQILARVADSQSAHGARNSAFATAGFIDNDDVRDRTFSDLYGQYGNQDDGLGFGGGRAAGAGGGITAADFDELINLILETIDPDSWEENGGSGRMMPFPAGVYVDSQGTLSKIELGNSRKLNDIREQAANQLDDPNVLVETPLRKISLTRLERALQQLAAKSEAPSPDMLHLGGMYQLKYVIFYPQTRDVVIAGPAGPWHFDAEGRAINTKSGHPVLYLDDLVVCLRNAKESNGQFGCSIDPRAANLATLKEFQDTTTLKGAAWSQRLREILGQQDVIVRGIDPATHAARVLVEADYRMKLVGMGLEPAVPGLKTYFDRLHLDEQGNPPQTDVVRWWFTMNYDAVQANHDRNIFEILGQGVKVLSESEFLDAQGRRVHTGKSTSATKGFADDFTRYYPQMTEKYSIYGELKNLFDCALAANLIHNEGLARKVDWKLHYFDARGTADGLVYQVAAENVPRQVDSVISEKVLRQRLGNRTRKHTIVGVSGGVEYDVTEIAAPANIKLVNQTGLSDTQKKSRPSQTVSRTWWWD